MTEVGCEPKESNSRSTHLMNILQSLSKLGWRGNRKISQAETSNKDKDGNKQVYFLYRTILYRTIVLSFCIVYFVSYYFFIVHSTPLFPPGCKCPVLWGGLRRQVIDEKGEAITDSTEAAPNMLE